jgi:hypothetical protein
MELDLQSLFGLHVHSCTHWLKRDPATLPPFPHIRGRYWSAKERLHLFEPLIVTQIINTITLAEVLSIQMEEKLRHYHTRTLPICVKCVYDGSVRLSQQ